LATTVVCTGLRCVPLPAPWRRTPLLLPSTGTLAGCARCPVPVDLGNARRIADPVRPAAEQLGSEGDDTAHCFSTQPGGCTSISTLL